jgi:Uma2 family endonuclease
MAAGTRLTLEEWLAMPDTEPASEFVCGEVIQEPMPGRAHSLVRSYFLGVRHDWVRGRSGAELTRVFGPQGGERGSVPDVCFVRWTPSPRRSRSTAPTPTLFRCRRPASSRG